MDYPRCEVKETYVSVSGKFDGLLYEPTVKNELSKIGIVAMHGGGNGRGDLNKELLKDFASFGFIAMNGCPAHFDFITQFSDLKAQVDMMKSIPGVEKVLLVGHSRGASLTSAYQAIAENSSDIYNRSDRLVPFPKVPELTPCDGIMFTDANYGFMFALCMSPAVVEEGNAMKIDPELDPLNPDNGYKPEGPEYTKEFLTKFFRAQSARYNRLLAQAKERYDLIKAGKGNFAENEPFLIAESYGGLTDYKMMALDNRLLEHSRNKHDLVHPDGSITNEIIHSVRKPYAEVRPKSTLAFNCFYTTVNEFLYSEVKIDEDFGYDEDHFWGIHWDSGFELVPCNVEHISVPMIALGMTGGHECLAAEYIYEHSASEDKSIAFIEGATHGLFPSKETEAYPGQWGDTVLTTARYLTGWITQPGRYM